MNETTFNVPDIECQACALAIKKALGRLAGIGDVRVNVADKQVTVWHNPTTVPRDVLVKALDSAGFPTA